LLTAFAALSLLLVVIGVYGLVAFDVAQRTRELGLRIALGATREGVVGLLLAESSRMLLLGLAVGSAGSFLASRLLAATYFEAQGNAAGLIIATTLLLTLAVLAATLVPARRAAYIDPMQALRSE
jgi:ABC-type antimicrobial peptide transport system permease subunit